MCVVDPAPRREGQILYGPTPGTLDLNPTMTARKLKHPTDGRVTNNVGAEGIEGGVIHFLEESLLLGRPALS
jgi:hypothetical protein